MMDNSVTISIERYDELLDIETRVDVVVDMIARNDYVSMSNVLRILGSEYALDVAKEIENKTRNLTFEEVLDEIDD